MAVTQPPACPRHARERVRSLSCMRLVALALLGILLIGLTALGALTPIHDSLPTFVTLSLAQAGVYGVPAARQGRRPRTPRRGRTVRRQILGRRPFGTMRRPARCLEIGVGYAQNKVRVRTAH